MTEENRKPYAPIERDPSDPVQAIPNVPTVNDNTPDASSLQLSKHRTKLSTHRTYLSEHRTGLSEKRTRLSEHRTSLSNERTEMSSRRTGMSFQRTRMSADRTLMSVIRTSLSMISFGFTINQAFHGLLKTHVIDDARAPAVFGLTLVYLGVGMIAVGILYHVQFMRGLRGERKTMTAHGYIHGDSVFPVSLTFIVALLLLLLGVAAIAGIAFRVGPFD
ncbi:MAG: DUF202 domain-containing protein [Pseudomonadota bacterium]